METLYDLLGALPRDGAEELRAAFRRAVKGVHPDLNPGDPDAGQKFREIVRANEILGDDDQRAAYDHLLGLAHKEQRQHVTVRTMHKLATGVIAAVVAAGASVGGYFLHQEMPKLSRQTRHLAEMVTASPADFANLPRAAETRPQQSASVEPEASLEDVKVEADPAEIKVQSASLEPAVEEGEIANVLPVAPVATAPQAEPESTPQAAAGPPLEIAPGDARVFRERGIFAYRSGDLDGAVAEFDRAIQLDPKFSAAYVDRGIVLYRLQKFARAFADIAHAKRIEKNKRAKPTHPDRATQHEAKRPKPPQATAAAGLPPMLHRRTAKLE